MSATQTTQTSQPVPDIAKPKPKSAIETLINHPIGFWFIFWGELAERCSFYGMMAILPRFIADEAGLFLGDANSNTWVSMFKGAAYTLPLVGGLLADQFFGKYRLIVMFSIPYILGHFLMSFETVLWTMIALSLLAAGSGMIKPNISTLMGMTYDQKRPGEDALRSTAFGMFYMAINIGAAASYAFLPPIRDNYGYAIAFMCPAVLMAVSFLIFAAGKPFYAVEKIVRRQATPEERHLKWLTLRRIAGIFLVITFFWAIFDQSHTIWIFFARDFTDLHIFGQEISVEQIGTLNPVLIVVFVPMMPFLWNFVESKGYRVRPTDKVILGFILTMFSMGIMAIAGYQADPYIDKDVKRSERAITKLVYNDPSKVSITVSAGKKEDEKKRESKKKDNTKPQVVVAATELVTVTVIEEKEKEARKRVVGLRYEMDARPILNKSCVRCHGAEPKADLDLRTLAGVLKGGKSGSAVTPKDASRSTLFSAHQNLTHAPDEDDWISPDQIGVLRQWVDQGATSVKERSVSIWWEVLAFTMLTLAEVLISITGLELAFVVAPQSMKSFITALWLMTVAIANFFINAPVGRLYSNPFPGTTHTMSPGEYHLMLTGLMVVVIVVFYIVSLRFNQLADEQKAAELSAAAKAEEGSPDPAGGVLPGPAASEGIQDKARRDGFIDPDKKDGPAA